MDKGNMIYDNDYISLQAYIFKYVLFNHKKEKKSVICNNVPWEYYAKLNKSDREKLLLRDLTYSGI